MEFTFKRQEIVVPSPPSPHHLVALSGIDQAAPPVYTPFLYFFPPPASPPSSKSVTDTLALALAAFPPVAGRLKARGNGSAGVDVECHNQGVVFVEAHATATLAHLLTTGKGEVYQPSSLWSALAPNPYDEAFADDKPLLFTQMTRMGCGGVVMAVMLHHLVADGNAQMHFVASWAELACGSSSNVHMMITSHPHLNRDCIQARTPPSPLFHHPEYIIHKPGHPTNSTTTTTTTTSRIFEFLPDSIDALQQQADADTSEFQALVAHIWRYVTKALRLDASQRVKIGWAVDGRKRFTNPPLPPNYFGNAVFYGCAEESASWVVTAPQIDISQTIRSGTERVTDEYMRSALDLIGSQSSPTLVSVSFKAPVDVTITSWKHFKAYQVDWGWGVPSFFALPISGVPISIGGALVVLLPHVTPHAVNVLITMAHPHMDALLLDSQFHPLASPNLVDTPTSQSK